MPEVLTEAEPNDSADNAGRWICPRDPLHRRVLNARTEKWYCPKCLSAAGKRGADKVHRENRAALLIKLRDHTKSKFESAMDEGHKIAESVIATNKANAECTRLERDVIETAKAEIVASDEYEKHLLMANWKRSVETREARQKAVRALIDFESSQHQIKK